MKKILYIILLILLFSSCPCPTTPSVNTIVGHWEGSKARNEDIFLNDMIISVDNKIEITGYMNGVKYAHIEYFYEIISETVIQTTITNIIYDLYNDSADVGTTTTFNYSLVDDNTLVFTYETESATYSRVIE